MKHLIDRDQIAVFRIWMVHYTHIGRCIHLLMMTICCLREFGIRVTADKIRNYLRRRRTRKETERTYAEWMDHHSPSEKELKVQRAVHFEREILISVLVPLYNTQAKILRDMLDSVLAQTYPGWELCIADGSDDRHGYTETICRGYAAADPRIRYRKLEKNGGISANTNVCIEMAAGEYVALLDHDDMLAPSALFRMMEVICREDPDVIYTDEAVFLSPDIRHIRYIHFKPDFAPDNLRANNYICHFTAFKKVLLEKTGLYRSAYDGSQDHDMMLRLAAVTDRFAHIPEPLYFWRASPTSVALSIDSKSGAASAGRKAVRDNLRALGIEAEVESSERSSTIYRIHYPLTACPKVSIIVPTCDHISYLKRCLESIEDKSTYRNFEIILVENNSRRRDTFAYYKEVKKRWDNVRLIRWQGPWNWSAINNYAVRAAKGSVLLLLNNDTEVISPNWIEEMLMYAQRDDVGAVGAKLYYANGTIQHAGVVLGLEGGLFGHIFRGVPGYDSGYAGRLHFAQDMSAVTGACLMLRREVWEEIGGLDEAFAVCDNDIDLCMRLRSAGYLVVWTPFAELTHYESVSRGLDDTPRKLRRREKEKERFVSRWGGTIAAGDPYFNPNLSLFYRVLRL